MNEIERKTEELHALNDIYQFCINHAMEYQSYYDDANEDDAWRESYKIRAGTYRCAAEMVIDWATGAKRK